ncbi:hypothetical protein [Marixanthomonas ophiurae]|uniref:DUF1328 domain-containing protein n=1 Tax=Marixanthomonas ophiurae TaxID=387659 RepID=A0A3E1QCU5_9FLAO|nr:hypothetical protein [Marixanthomonas ophiurae]RFN59975.1 hypothetical protein DZ858_07985 [Marixanthomonas ophiurae]
MKNYTLHFLILTIITAVIGFSGLEFIGGSVVRFICLISGIGLLISCLDSVLITRKNRKFKKQVAPKKVKSDSGSRNFSNNH